MTLFEEVQNMSEEEKAQLLSADFGPELEKQAAAEVGQAVLADSLYTYGAYLADLEVDSTGELSKEASAAYNEVGTEIAASLEMGLMESGILECEDTVALHKEAQAAAAIMFRGYADQFEKIADEATEAAKKSFSEGLDKMPGMSNEMKKKMESTTHAPSKLMKLRNKLYTAAKNNPKATAGLAAAGLGLAGAGAYAYKKHHEKKASELTVAEMSQAVAEDMHFNDVVTEGLNKLAADGEAKAPEAAGKFKKSMDWVKAKGKKAGEHAAALGSKIKAHPYRAGAAGAAALGLGGAGVYAYKKHKEKKG